MDPVVALPQQDWVDALVDVPGVELVLWDMEDAPPRDDIALVVPPYMRAGRRQLAHLQQCPQLRAVQLVTAGYEHAQPHLPSGVQLANGAGIHDTSTAELAVGLALASLRGIPEATRAAQEGTWTSLTGRRSLADRRVLILGYGSIGRAIARRLQPFEVLLTAVASRARAGDDLVDQVHGTGELPDLLPHHDVVIVVVPLSDATRHMVGADFLSALPDGALVVNVARGGVVDTDALVRECARRVGSPPPSTSPIPNPCPTGIPSGRRPGCWSPRMSAVRPRRSPLARWPSCAANSPRSAGVKRCPT